MPATTFKGVQSPGIAPTTSVGPAKLEMSHNQETELLAPHAADGLIHAHDATGKMGGGGGIPGDKSKTKKKKTARDHMKYHKPTSKRRAIQVACRRSLRKVHVAVKLMSGGARAARL